MKIRTSRLVATLTLFCIALLPKMQAVSPAPDGCYLNFTTAEGCNALNFLTTGAGNTGLGWRSLFLDSTGSFNTGVGAGTLVFNNADSNTAVGAAALLLNTTGTENTATGTDALVFNDSGSFNTAVGDQALLNNTTGDVNTAIGAGALAFNDIGNHNTAIGGDFVLFSNTSGSYNTAIGVDALSNNTTGDTNIALGTFAGALLTTGSFNIDIGHVGVAGEGFTIRIGDGQTRTFVEGIRDVTTGNNNAINVVIDSAGQLGTMSSARRFKKEIKPMDKASEAILALKPVTFHYRGDKTNRPEFGLVAEDVAEVNPDLVVCNERGDIYTVRYDAVNAMLLNEFLKEHNKVEEQQVTITELKLTLAQQRKDFEKAIARQQKGMDALTAQLKEEASQIQKVRTQVELNRSATKLAREDQ